MSAIWPGALLVVYLSAAGALLLLGHSRVRPLGVVAHFAMLAAIVAATWLPTTPRWLRDWAPLLALLFLYSEMPMLIRAAGHASLFDGTVIGWERALFAGQPALAWAAAWRSRVWSELLHAAYLSYYPIIFSVPVLLYFSGRKAEFSDAVFVLMLTFVTCFLCYIAFPVAGPRYLWGSPADATGSVFRTMAAQLLEARSSRGTAFPSSHVAVAVCQSILAARYFGKRGLIIAVLTTGLGLGAVYGGFHYAVDVLAGAGLGAVTTYLGLATTRRLAGKSRQANASAPT